MDNLGTRLTWNEARDRSIDSYILI